MDNCLKRSTVDEGEAEPHDAASKAGGAGGSGGRQRQQEQEPPADLREISGWWLGRLLSPGWHWRLSRDPCIRHARDAVTSIAWRRARASRSAAAAHLAWSEALARQVPLAAEAAAAAAAAAAAGSAEDAAAAKAAVARLEAANALVRQLEQVPTRLQSMEMGIHADIVCLKDFTDAAVLRQGWKDWATFFDVWVKVLAALATVFAYSAGIYDGKKWLAFVAGILGTAALAILGLASYSRKQSKEYNGKLQELRSYFNSRSAAVEGRPGLASAMLAPARAPAGAAKDAGSGAAECSSPAAAGPAGVVPMQPSTLPTGMAAA